MANTDQDRIDGLVRAGMEARAEARAAGDVSDAWLERFNDELLACGMTPAKLKTAIETFDSQVAADVKAAMRSTGLSLG